MTTISLFQDIIRNVATEEVPGYLAAKRSIQTLTVYERRNLAESARIIEGLCKEVGI